MNVNEVFYILYIQKSPATGKYRRMVVFYAKENLAPLYAFNLNPRNSIPKEYHMLEYVTITGTQFKYFIKQFEDMGILQEYGRGIANGSN